MKFISLHFITTLKIHFHKILVKGHSKLQVTLIQNWCFQTVILEKTLESLLDSKEIKPINAKGNQPWIFIGKTDAEAPEPTHWKRPWCWKRLRTGGEGADRGWDGWIASPTQWTRVWASSRRWWWTGKPGKLQSMGSQRVRHAWATEQHYRCPGPWTTVQ